MIMIKRKADWTPTMEQRAGLEGRQVKCLIASEGHLWMQHYYVCVPKTKSERIDDEVRPRWRANLWCRIAEPDERPAHPFAKTDAF